MVDVHSVNIRHWERRNTHENVAFSRGNHFPNSILEGVFSFSLDLHPRKSDSICGIAYQYPYFLVQKTPVNHSSRWSQPPLPQCSSSEQIIWYFLPGNSSYSKCIGRICKRFLSAHWSWKLFQIAELPRKCSKEAKRRLQAPSGSHLHMCLPHYYHLPVANVPRELSSWYPWVT